MNKSTSEMMTSELAADYAAPSELVTAAIAAADYGNNGAPFAPFLVKFADPADFVNGWTARRGNAISFYGEYNGNSGSFLPLGDFAAVNNTPIAKTPILLLAPMPDHEDALKHPDGFSWILDDIHSGNPNNIAYYWPTAPPGYQALGICVGFNGQVPDKTKYWCVKNNYVQSAPTREFWSDAGSHWTSHDGSLSAPSMTGVGEQESKILIAPTTMLSNAHGNLQNTSLCLVMDKLLLSVPEANPVLPAYDPNNKDGTTTVPGLERVAVLPAVLIDDPAFTSSPFYYLAAEPRWLCTGTFPSKDGGTQTWTLEVGTKQEDSSSFQRTTSLTVGAEVGIEAGPFSAKGSVSYTEDMQLTESVVSGTDTQRKEELQLNLPKTNHLQVWQRETDFVVYREAGDVMSVVTFQKRDICYTESNLT